MGVNALSYPATLTNKEWQKNKGVIAKVAAGATGVGDKLTALEKAFAGSLCAKAQALPKTLDPDEFASLMAKLGPTVTKQSELIANAAINAEKAAKAAQQTLKGNKAVPASVTKYLDQVLADLSKFKIVVRNYPADFGKTMTTEFKQAVKSHPVAVTLNLSATDTERKWKALIADIKACEKAGTIQAAESAFAGDNNARGITTACKLWDQLIVKTFPQTARKVYAGKAMSDYFTLPNLAEAADQKAAAGLKKRLAGSKHPEARVVQQYMLELSSAAVKSGELVGHLKKLNARIQSL